MFNGMEAVKVAEEMLEFMDKIETEYKDEIHKKIINELQREIREKLLEIKSAGESGYY